MAASSGRAVVLWNIATDSEHARLVGHRTWVRRIAASPDGWLIATGDDDGDIRLWNLADGTEHTTITGRLGKVTALGVRAGRPFPRRAPRCSTCPRAPSRPGAGWIDTSALPG
ncbi:WD40 repeat domain-containing protein, partial [Protofrankia symbiont of Coriaria ruscifolia]|uniref:WD40 repeat domain-containing protein n=1 Tax=Protofrankia symbiont of Coriaria ruscifolia TaxID=1306542 RepID=UPI003D6D1AC9